MNNYIRCSLFAILWGFTSMLHAANGISRFVSLPEMRSGSVGFCIVDIETGKTVSSFDPGRVLLPASVLKLLTTATALDMYGADHRFYTDVEYFGKITSGGVLQGDLYIRGCGDPTLGSEYGTRPVSAFGDQLLQALKSAGISAIKGRIVADDSRFDTEGVSPKWLWEDVGNYFAAGSYGINYRDNTYRLILHSGARGSRPVILEVDPVVPGLTFTNYLTASTNPADSAYIYGAPFSLQRSVYGTIPENRSRFVVKGDLPDPALFMAYELTTFLNRHQINISEQPVTVRMLSESGKKQPEEPCRLLMKYPSDPLSYIISEVNHKSNNLYAETLLRWIALKRYPVASASKGVDVLKRFWKEKGVSLEALVMYDGNGLSPVNRISAGMLCEVLTSVASIPQLQPLFTSSLPRPGVNGTVRSFLKNSPLASGLWLKSGSMANVQSYAGYYTGKKKYAVAVIVNNFSGSRSRLKAALEQMFEAELKDL